MRVTLVDLAALLLLAAAAGQHTTIVDRSSGAALQIVSPASAPTTKDLVREMLTHD